jgi:predicted transcriptional regulator
MELANMAEQIAGQLKGDAVSMTADIVAAYVRGNTLERDELPALIRHVHASVAGLAEGSSTPVHIALTPAVPIKKSVTPEFIICLEDGKKFKSLKRHLGSSFNLTPEQYRAKWGLPHDYPMVASAYAATRSALAKSIGLGQLRKGKRAVAANPAMTSARKEVSKKTASTGKSGPKPAKKSSRGKATGN